MSNGVNQNENTLYGKTKDGQPVEVTNDHIVVNGQVVISLVNPLTTEQSQDSSLRRDGNEQLPLDLVFEDTLPLEDVLTPETVKKVYVDSKGQQFYVGERNTRNQWAVDKVAEVPSRLVSETNAARVYEFGGGRSAVLPKAGFGVRQFEEMKSRLHRIQEMQAKLPIQQHQIIRGDGHNTKGIFLDSVPKLSASEQYFDHPDELYKLSLLIAKAALLLEDHGINIYVGRGLSIDNSDTSGRTCRVVTDENGKAIDVKIMLQDITTQQINSGYPSYAVAAYLMPGKPYSIHPKSGVRYYTGFGFDDEYMDCLYRSIEGGWVSYEVQIDIFSRLLEGQDLKPLMIEHEVIAEE